MGFTRITDDDTQNRGVIGLPDTPNYSTAEMQEKLDELALAVIIPKINNLISELEGMSAALSLGITVPAGLTAESNLQSVIDTIYGLLAGVGAAEHSHDNKTVLDTITDALIKGLEDIASSLAGITGVTNSVNGSATELVTAKAVADYVQVLGGGDMTRAIYDANLDGIVDDAEKLGGELPSYYQSATDNRLTTVAKTIVDAINELANKEVSVLDTAEEIKANTTNGKAAGANGVKQLFEEVNDNLSEQPSFVYDEEGQITGYTTKIGGADTVFPFSSGGEITIPLLTASRSGTTSGGTVGNLEFQLSVENFSKMSIDSISTQYYGSCSIYGDGSLIKSYGGNQSGAKLEETDISSISTITIVLSSGYGEVNGTSSRIMNLKFW